MDELPVGAPPGSPDARTAVPEPDETAAATDDPGSGAHTVASRPRGSGRRAGVAALAVCLALGIAGSTPIPSGPGPGLSRGGSHVAVASATIAGPAPSSGASPTGVPSTSVGPDQGSTPLPVRTPLPSQTSPTASITFNDLALDPPVPQASPLTFTFVSDGPGPVSAQVVSTTGMDPTRLCFSLDGAVPSCASGAAPGFSSDVAATGTSRWTVTLTSAGQGSPTVDVAFSWPVDSAAITLTNGRLEGTPNSDSRRSVTATFKARYAGRLTLEAAWPSPHANVTLTLAEEGAATPIVVDVVRYLDLPSLAPAYEHPVMAGKAYRVQLMNDSAAGAIPSLTATIAIP